MCVFVREGRSFSSWKSVFLLSVTLSICHTFYLYFSLDLVLFHQSDAPVVLITNFFSLIQGVMPIRRFLQILSSQTECPKHKHSRISRDEFHEKCWAGYF
ncbi:Hypothetical predicted protein [Olea europaea subsp. europaea]|uniref:Uncharacterized protein n=1 Tax=Olea europaea subsp. europaea TaxID=158383 RepID=A0A8S0V039_OLEEU|nr:Hypothetical predicted protein [Olea europaea subsp. europaea]